MDCRLYVFSFAASIRNVDAFKATKKHMFMILLCLILSTVANVGNAAPIFFQFSGTIEEGTAGASHIADYSGTLASAGIGPNSAFTGYFSYDPSTITTDFIDGYIAQYSGFSIRLNLAFSSGATIDSRSATLIVSSGFRVFAPQPGENLAYETAPQLLNLVLADTDASFIDSFDVPTELPFSEFETASIEFMGPYPHLDGFVGTITSVVPVSAIPLPGGFWLFVSAVLSVVAASKRWQLRTSGNKNV